MKRDKREFELKLELDAEGVTALAAHPAVTALGTAPPRKRMLRSTYFDTRDRRLHAAGIALRIREAGGRRVQTVKQGTRVSSGISNPVEIEGPVDRAWPDLDAVGDAAMRARVEELVGDETLEALFTTEIERHEHQLAIDGTRAELALDRGRIVAADRTIPLREAELELKSGDVDAFLDMATRILDASRFRFSSLSKARKGYLLLAGGQPEPLRPVKAWRPELDAKQDAAQSFARICESNCDQILRNWAGLPEDDDPEFAHQLRVGLRRQRSALKVFRDLVDTDSMRALNADLGKVGRIVGALRNLDVMVEDIVRPALEHARATEPGDKLGALVKEQCALERRRVREELKRKRWNPLLLRIALLPHGAGWQRDIAEGPGIEAFAGRALDRCWRQVRKRADRLEALSVEQRHRLRKDLKVLRYAIEFFASILPGRETGEFVRQLRRLQNRFGYLNDVALAQTLPDLLAGAAAKDPKLAGTIGFILGWHSARAAAELADASALWKQLAAQPRPWS